MKTSALLLFLCLSAFGQSPDAIKYSPRQVLLVDPTPGAEAVLPMMLLASGQQHLEFVPVHQVKEYLDKGARPVTLADILVVLGTATDKVNQLQAENDRLWKIAMKDAPKPDTVIVQQPPPVDPAAQQQAEANARRQQALQMWLALQNRTQNVNVNVVNCTRLPALCAGR